MPRTTLRTLLIGAVAVCCHLGATCPSSAQQEIIVDSDIPNQLETLPTPVEGYAPGSGYPQGVELGQAQGARVPYGFGGQADLFYNYYATPGSTSAAMYPAPRPTPALVGHTWYTYQPWLPHEYLYKHHRVYWTYYGHFHGGCNGQYQGCPSINKTTVTYGRGYIRPFFCYRFRR